MSGPLAIAGVTAVLRNLLDNSLIEANLTTATGTKVNVTALPPDSIPIDSTNKATQLNLFLYHVTPNQGWRNEGLPSRDGAGRRLTNPPLALDLHYLLTAYGAAELHAEILLGYAMSVLHENPVLDRQLVRNALAGGSLDLSILPTAFQSLAASDLADQIEMIKLTPEALGQEEMSRLWSALQAHYRPTACYQASVVLIEARRPTRATLPVLSRGPVDPVSHRDRGVVVQPTLLSPLPTLLDVEPITSELGTTIVLDGLNLEGTNRRVRFEHRLLTAPIELTPAAGPDPNRVSVALPGDAAASQAWPAGTWLVSVLVQRPGETERRVSNALPFLLAPTMLLGAGETTVARDATTQAVTVSLQLRPEAWPGQIISLLIDGREAFAPPRIARTASIDFVFERLAAGSHLARVRVDGAESRLIDRSVTPPQFLASQRITVPA